MSRQVGWWEVENDNKHDICACYWNGSMWQWSKGTDSYRQRMKPIVFIGPASLPFTLEAGKRYCTVKPDGTAGPVVELRFSKDEIGVSRNSPFPLRVVGSFNYVSGGSCFCPLSGTLLYRITAPYEEPKPPTLAQQLRDWFDGRGKDGFNELLAKVAELEASK